MANQPGETTATGPLMSSAQLTAFLADCLTNREGQLPRHVDLDLGGVDSPNLEPSLLQLLGATNSSELLVGVSLLSARDLAACRSEWGEPAYRIDLRPGTTSTLAWDIWRMSGKVLIEETAAGASLVLAAHNPRWLLYTQPDEIHPMLFSGPLACPRHHADPPAHNGRTDEIASQ